MESKKITKEQIDSFLQGSNDMKYIIKIEGNYNDDKMCVIYKDEDGKKKISHEPFHPFCWAKAEAARSLYGGDRKKIAQKLSEYQIEAIGLRVSDNDGNVPERMEKGYRIMFRAKAAMTYQKFLKFFNDGGKPLYSDKDDGKKDFICVAPVEQFMIATGKRQFKGYDDYDDLLRMQFDLETEGLDPKKDCISQIGIRTNKGFEKIITIEGEGQEKLNNEIKGLREFFLIVNEIKPDVLSGHNIENFDDWFIDERLKLRGLSLETFTEDIFPHRGIYKSNKQKVLKLGGEMEYYYPTVMWGVHITDSLFAVRRAQAIDSSMKSATLKYVTKYSGIAKKNRVYVPGKIINKTWEDLNKNYAFDDNNGKWFKIDENILSKTLSDGTPKYEKTQESFVDKENDENFEFVTGRYIVQRYLLDDLWETDKVELQYNQPNYLVSKMLPVSFEKVCTMGTAAIWKYIMLAWSYENGLAVPEITSKTNFVGGLSRLLLVGYVPDVVKLDWNSLYPSIYLTFNIKNSVDVMDVLLAILEYVLSMREHYKELKAIHGDNIDELKILLDNPFQNIEEIKSKISNEKLLKNKANILQLPLKILGNGYFGGSSSGQPFPWTDTNCVGPEKTTCIGRQMLRLMIYHFSNISKFGNRQLSEEYNYKPIVGDSFTADTPLFTKDNETGFIDIQPISELINETEINTDVLGREYDYSKKNYKVLCRRGWVEPSYIYRHKTDKPIYRVNKIDGIDSVLVEVTEDHSLFDSEQQKIKPSEIKENTKLEYYENDIHTNLFHSDDDDYIRGFAERTNPSIKIPKMIINADKKTRERYLKYLDEYLPNYIKLELNFSKTFIAGYNFIAK